MVRSVVLRWRHAAARCARFRGCTRDGCTRRTELAFCSLPSHNTLSSPALPLPSATFTLAFTYHPSCYTDCLSCAYNRTFAFSTPVSLSLPLYYCCLTFTPIRWRVRLGSFTVLAVLTTCFLATWAWLIPISCSLWMVR